MAAVIHREGEPPLVLRESHRARRAQKPVGVEYAHFQRFFALPPDRNAFVRGMVDSVLHGIAGSHHLKG